MCREDSFFFLPLIFWILADLSRPSVDIIFFSFLFLLLFGNKVATSTLAEDNNIWSPGRPDGLKPQFSKCTRGHIRSSELYIYKTF